MEYDPRIPLGLAKDEPDERAVLKQRLKEKDMTIDVLRYTLNSSLGFRDAEIEGFLEPRNGEIQHLRSILSNRVAEIERLNAELEHYRTARILSETESQNMDNDPRTPISARDELEALTAKLSAKETVIFFQEGKIADLEKKAAALEAELEALRLRKKVINIHIPPPSAHSLHGDMDLEAISHSDSHSDTSVND
jgi:predicted RNase H-like nuclease (RuvC/YqgF family)